MGNILVTKCDICKTPYNADYNNPIVHIHHINKKNRVKVCIKCLKKDKTRLRLNIIYRKNI